MVLLFLLLTQTNVSMVFVGGFHLKIPLVLVKNVTINTMTTEDALKMLEQTGKIPSTLKNPGMIIDLYNNRLEEKKKRSFNQKITDMNHYYFKLIVDTMTQRANGIINPIYKSTTKLIT